MEGKEIYMVKGKTHIVKSLREKSGKTVSKILVGAMLLASAGTFTGCDANPEFGKQGSQYEKQDGIGLVGSGDSTEDNSDPGNANPGIGGSSSTNGLNVSAGTRAAANVPGYVQSKSYYDYDFADEENADFEALLDEIFENTVTSDSISYNFQVKDGSNYGVEAPEATLGDPSMDDEAIAEQKEDDQEMYKKLVAFEDQPLTESERWTYLNEKLDYEISLQIYDYIQFYEPFSPMRGLQSNIPTNFTDYRFDDKSDVEDYVAMMYQMRDYFDGYLDWERVKSEKGYFMADSTADQVIEQCNDFTEDPENNYMISVFNDRIDELDFLTDEEKESFKEQNKDAMINYVIPAFQDLADTMAELKGTGTNDGGLCNYDGGLAYYEDYLLPSFVGGTKDADTMMEYLQEQQDSLISDLSLIYYGNDEIYNDYYDKSDSLFAKTDSMTPSEQIDELMSGSMDNFPKLDTIPYTASYMDKSMEDIMENTLAYYMSPAIDDEEHNIIIVNGKHNSDLWGTLAHEGCPGHMFQNTYFQQTHPDKVRALAGNLGYQEGWAVYSSYEILPYYNFDDSYSTSDNEAMAELYSINEKLGYLIYGVIDIGVNAKGWTVDDVSNYLEESGFGTDGAQDIFDTVVGDPACYLSYSQGYFEMQELRDQAENAISDFDPVTFHECILSAGPCNYVLLQQRVDKYIEDNQ